MNPLKDNFSKFVSSLEKIASDVMSLDVKTIRNSGKEKALHIVSVWCHQNQMVFVQERMDAKGDYVIALKVNQGTLYEDIKNHEMTNENNDKGHGPLEQRVAAIAHDIAWLSLL